jgi:hypothetical protein
VKSLNPALAEGLDAGADSAVDSVEDSAADLAAKGAEQEVHSVGAEAPADLVVPLGRGADPVVGLEAVGAVVGVVEAVAERGAGHAIARQ